MCFGWRSLSGGFRWTVFVGRFPSGVSRRRRGAPSAEAAKNRAGGCILKKNAYLCSAYEHRIELWCNGNTSDFGSGILGSNPGSSTKTRQVSVSEPAFCFRLCIERAGCSRRSLSRCFASKFNCIAIGSPQPRVAVEVLAGKIGRAATGSPLPPPGGGLHLRVPKVRSCRLIRSAAGFFAQIQSRSDRRAAAWGRRRPAARVPKVRFERALRRLRPEQ